ncbi:MAG: nucleotidyl transferase AbiEii/AbiGii toxin family protein [Patescibacteria group bacterium]
MEKENYQKILGKKTGRDLEILKKVDLPKGFYLAGGTGVALFLKHRRSFDLDFFTQKSFRADLLVKKLAKAGKFRLERKGEGTILGYFGETRVSFFSYPYPLIKPLRKINGIMVADILDIACMKLDAIASRGSKKDFIDLYEIIQSGHSLKDLLGWFNQKYKGLDYNILHLKKGLVYFDDADKERGLILLKDIDWEEVKDFFRQELKNSSID